MYTVYNTDGKITEITNDEPNTNLFIEGWYHWNQYYVVDGQPVEFPARPSDSYEWDWIGKQWVIKQSEELKKLLREKRGTLLRESDWIVLKCYEKGIPVPTRWKTYRQALRDITKNPTNPVWPSEPTDTEED